MFWDVPVYAQKVLFIAVGWVCVYWWHLVTTSLTVGCSESEVQPEHNISLHRKAGTAHWVKQSSDVLIVCFEYTSERNNLLALTGWGIYSKSHKKSVAGLGQFRCFWAGGMVSGWLKYLRKAWSKETSEIFIWKYSSEPKEDDQGLEVELEASAETAWVTLSWPVSTSLDNQI